jgi:nucleotide-binding universal stress UspA family protein
MFTRVLVGLDRRSGGRDALALAKMLVTEGGGLTLVHVYSGDSRLLPGSAFEHETLERDRGFKLLSEARDQAGVDAEIRCTWAAPVGRGLHEAAEAEGADLLVVGSSRRGVVGRLLLGDDTLGALNGAPCAVAIAPAGYAQQQASIDAIGVAYNATSESEHALSVARALAREHHARLSACEVVTLPVYAFAAGAAPIDGAIDGLVGEARGRIEELGGVEAHAVYGNAVSELALYSGSVDLLVVGSRGYGPAGRLVHGSISNGLTHAARCPLIVLPRAAWDIASATANGVGSGASATP